MDDSCGAIDVGSDLFHLRVAAVFIVLVTATSAALFPVLAKRSTRIQVPDLAYDAAKYFGSGVIVRLSVSTPLCSSL